MLDFYFKSMHGFICIVSKEKPLDPISIKWKDDFSFQKEMVTRNIKNEFYHIEQHTQSKFLPEKLWINNDEMLCVTEGIVLNLDELIKEYNAKDKEELISLMIRNNPLFFENFEGDFIGFCYLKKENKWTFFNNRSGTKKLYYYKDESYLICSTDLFTLSRALKELNITFSLDIQAAYLMLSSGCIFEDLTPIKEVSKLRAGEYIQVTNHQLDCQFYFHLKNIKQTSDSKETIINKLDKKFKRAIEMEFKLNEKYNLQNVTTLSGGLDSRMVALIGHKLGYTDQQLLNFSEPGYADQVIAKQIADVYQMPISQHNLVPELLLDIDRVIAVNDGMGIYTGCSHVFSVVKDLNIPSVGYFHTGVIGDTIMGNLTDNHQAFQNKLFSSTLVFDVAKEYIEKLIVDYDNDIEMAVIYNSIFTNESNGFLYFDLIGATSSPFLNNEFLQYAFSIPRKYRLNTSIYIDWINKLHPDIGSFTWETIGGPPTNDKLKRFIYRLKRAIIKRLPIKNMWKNGMNPEQLWYDNNTEVKSQLDNYFFNNLDRINDVTLRNDAKKLYEIGDFDSKARCLTLVGTLKLFFS